MAAKGGTRGVFKAPARGPKAFLSVYFGVVPRPPKEVVTGQRFLRTPGGNWTRAEPFYKGAKEILSLQTILSPLAGLFLPASSTGGSRKTFTPGYCLITPPGLEPLIFSHDRRDRRASASFAPRR